MPAGGLTSVRVVLGVLGVIAPNRMRIDLGDARIDRQVPVVHVLVVAEAAERIESTVAHPLARPGNCISNLGKFPKGLDAVGVLELDFRRAVPIDLQCEGGVSFAHTQYKDRCTEKCQKNSAGLRSTRVAGSFRKAGDGWNPRGLPSWSKVDCRLQAFPQWAQQVVVAPTATIFNALENAVTNGALVASTRAVSIGGDRSHDAGIAS